MNCNQLIVLCCAYRGSFPSDETTRSNFQEDVAFLTNNGLIVMKEGRIQTTKKGHIYVETCLKLKEVTTFEVTK